MNWTAVCYTSGKCSGGTNYSLTFSDLLNPPHNGTNNNLTYIIRTYSSGGYLIDNGTAYNTIFTIYPSKLSAQLVAPTSPVIAGANTFYTLSI